MRVSYHTHSNFCDGQCHMEDYVKKALEYKFAAMGFSSHAPIPWVTDWTMKPENLSKYLQTAYELKDKYRNKIQLYTGLEIDYIQGVDVTVPEKIEYYISSVHYAYSGETGGYTPVDGPYEYVINNLEKYYKGDTYKYVKDYYTAVKEMIEVRKPMFVGHLDLIKKNNRNNILFNETENRYIFEIESVLDVIKKYGCTVEINTGGMSRKYTDSSYPSCWIIKMMKEMDIPIVLNSDAHKPEWLNTEYDLYVKLLREIGYKKQKVLYDGIMQDVEID